MFISANLTAAEIEKKVKSAVRSKMALINTGEKSLAHDNITDLCSGLLEAAKELHKYLPSLIGL